MRGETSGLFREVQIVKELSYPVFTRRVRRNHKSKGDRAHSPRPLSLSCQIKRRVRERDPKEGKCKLTIPVSVFFIYLEVKTPQVDEGGEWTCTFYGRALT